MILATLLAATLTVHDYATMPQLSSPQWSPDGKRIAYVLTTADLTRSVYDADVWMIDADGRNNRRLTFSDSSETRPRWSPDGTQLAFLSDRGGKNAIYVLDLEGGEARQLTKEPTAIRQFEWSPRGGSIAYTRPDEPTAEEERRAAEKDDARVVGEGTKHIHLHTIDVKYAVAPSRVTSGDFSVLGFSWSPDGRMFVVDRAPGMGLDALYATDIHHVAVRGGETHPLVERPGLDRFATFSPDGKSIAFVSAGGTTDWLAEQTVYVVSMEDKKPRPISTSYGRTPEAIAWSDDSKAVLIEGPLGLRTQLFRAPLDGGEVTNVTRVEGIVSDADVHRDRVAYIAQTLTSPPELYVDGKPLTKHNDAFRDIGETRVIRWKNPNDGLEIEGLLTLPVGYEKGRLPLLTFVHGGPASRFDEGYLGYLGHVYAPHALAARGFAVFRPNPRGTGGYGQSFREANRNDWAEMPWRDIDAGIDMLVEAGIADPKRLGLMGWSYGGYIAAWALGHSNRFRAVSVGAPVVDFVSFHGTTDIRKFIPSYFPAMPPELLRAQSPLLQLKKSDTKVMIQHGEADDRVPLSQGTMLYRALDELGMDVTMIVYPRTPHVPREPKLRIDVARRNLEFFVDALEP